MFYIRKIVKRILPSHWLKLFETLEQRLQTIETSLKQIQRYLLYQQYPTLNLNKVNSSINQYEFKSYSQNGEDGILLYIFSLIGTTNQRIVEFGIGDGTECMSANLILNFGWQALLLECSPNGAMQARNFYTGFPVTVVEAQVTAENINQLLLPMAGEIDLLSIDIDSNDYWIWQAITVVQPRVVVIEYNASMGDKRSLTVKYAPDFQRFKISPSGYYHGASLTALYRLAEKRGYTFVGCDANGINAFFVRTDVLNNKLSTVTPQEAFYPHFKRIKRMTTEEQFALIAHAEFEEIL